MCFRLRGIAVREGNPWRSSVFLIRAQINALGREPLILSHNLAWLICSWKPPTTVYHLCKLFLLCSAFPVLLICRPSWDSAEGVQLSQTCLGDAASSLCWCLPGYRQPGRWEQATASKTFHERINCKAIFQSFTRGISRRSQLLPVTQPGDPKTQLLTMTHPPGECQGVHQTCSRKSMLIEAIKYHALYCCHL